MILKEFAESHGLKQGDPITTGGMVISHLDLREQKFDESGKPIPFDTPRYWCMICHKKIFHEPIVWQERGQWVISGEHAFHYKDTHGIPPEILDGVLGISRMMEMIPFRKERDENNGLQQKVG
jgi:hypothetical protein